MGLLIIVALVILGLAFLPQIWVRHVIKRYGVERPDFPGTGGEFARHILDEVGLRNVGVEETDMGDHYDPEAKVVRLSPEHYRGRSLSAVVIAAHEVGHAVQDATDYPPLKARTSIAKTATWLQNVAVVILMAAPLLVLIAKSPAVLLVQVAAIGLIILMTIAMHAVTLPVEFDASFRRAMPILASGGYIPDADMPAANEILRAAALTYVAAAAMSALNIFRWLRYIRF